MHAASPAPSPQAPPEAPRYAVTKIQPPRPRATQLARPALAAALAEACARHRVVLLQAAAGFGKTSALAALVAGQPADVATAWVALDPDDDAERLYACFVGALEAHDLPWRMSPAALVQWAGGDAAAQRRAADALVNALAGSGAARGLLVLDDLHRLREASAVALIDALVQRLPPHWTVVLASRTPPPLALARLRAQGDLAEFTADDLRFSADEAHTLLQPLADGSAGAGDLHARTGGWPAGLGLALVALRARPAERPAGSGAARIDRHVFDYLAAEVLDDLPAPLHDFLLRCSVLPELTAARAAAVSGDEHAAARLDEIERRGLFATALQSNERTLVLHDLFRDALQRRQAQRLPRETSALLHRAAASETDPARRVGYLLSAGDAAGAAAALAGHAEDLFLRGGAGDVLRLVEQFAPQQRDPRLACLAGAACELRWEWNEMARWYGQAAAAARAAGDRDVWHEAQAKLAYALYPLDRNDEAERLLAEIEHQPLAPATRAQWLIAHSMQQFRRGQHGRLPALYGEVLAIVECSESLLIWWHCAPPFNWTTIAGMPALIRRYISGAQPRLGERALPMRGELRLLTAMLRLWSGDVSGAEAAIAAAEEDIRWLGVSGEAEVGAAIFRLILDAVHGRGVALQQRLQALAAREDDRPAERRALWRHQIAVYGVRLSDTVGDAEALRHWAGQLKENPLVDALAQNPRAIATRARHAAATGRWADAVALFERLRDKLATMDVTGQRTDLTLRWAHALLREGRIADAARVLAPVLDRMIGEGARGQALLGAPVLPALAGARWGALLGDAQRAELEAATALAGGLRRGDAAAASPAPDDGLSAREREVLQRIAAGDSNKLIARALDISPHTVKRHVANILDKLGLATRGQAAAWLRDHG